MFTGECGNNFASTYRMDHKDGSATYTLDGVLTGNRPPYVLSVERPALADYDHANSVRLLNGAQVRPT